MTAPEGMREVNKEDLIENIEIGMHTGLRKGSDADDAHQLWTAISNSESSAWGDAAAYLVWAFECMGWKVYRPKKQDT